LIINLDKFYLAECFYGADSTMNPQRKGSQSVGKASVEEASASRILEEEDIDTPRPIYDDTKGFIDKETSLKWVEVYLMLNKQTFPQLPKDDPNFNTYKNIRRFILYKVTAHASIFPYVEAISWIVNHADLDTRYILNVQGFPITSFQASVIFSYYHLEEGEKVLDKNIVKIFLHIPMELLKS
jgi:hypothetical protein